MLKLLTENKELLNIRGTESCVVVKVQEIRDCISLISIKSLGFFSQLYGVSDYM